MNEFVVFRVPEGLGNACALLFEDQTAAVVDWGTDETDVLERLLELAPNGFRFVLATHGHEDHTLGLPRLIRACVERKLPIEYLFFPTDVNPTDGRDHLLEARFYAASNGIKMATLGVDEFTYHEGKRVLPVITSGDGWELAVLAPSRVAVSRDATKAIIQNRQTGNLTSIVLMYRAKDSEGHSGNALLPGDATPATLRFAYQSAAQSHIGSLDNDLLLVPHHGSHRNFPHWMETHTKGSFAFSTPFDRRHHPNEQVLERAARQCKGTGPRSVFCTSYSHHCRVKYAQGQNIGPACFGDLRFALNSDGIYLAASSDDGEAKRAFGYCGGVNA